MVTKIMGCENPYPDLPKGWFGSDAEAEIEHYAKRKGWDKGANAVLRSLINQPSNRGANVLHVGIEDDGSVILHNPHRKGHLVFIEEE